jgi:acyl carrier protein
LTYIGRNDDMLVMNSGVKVDSLAIERTIDALPQVQRSAVLVSKTAEHLICLIQPTGPVFSLDDMIRHILKLNSSLAFEKRIRSEAIYMVAELPVTTKLTLNRKKLKHLLSQITSDKDINLILPPPVVPSVPESMIPSSNPVVQYDFRHRIEHQKRLSQLLANVFCLEESVFTPSLKLSDIPLTSIAAIRLAEAIQKEFSVRIAGGKLYGIATVLDLDYYLWKQSVLMDAKETTSFSDSSAPQSMDGLPTYTSSGSDSIVISGVACRFVGGVSSLDDLWSAIIAPDVFIKNLDRKRPESRWKTSTEESKMYPSGWLDDETIFNTSSLSQFFGISPREAASMSPNARLVLQLGYQALNDAGIAPKSLNGKNWGIFTSVNDSGWRERNVTQMEPYGNIYSLLNPQYLD